MSFLGVGVWPIPVRRAQPAASVHHGRRQEFEVTDFQLPVFFDQNDFDIEVGIKVPVFLQLLRADALLARNLLKFLR
jgi:hypothetical protein